jgi:hypothetical protein
VYGLSEGNAPLQSSLVYPAQGSFVTTQFNRSSAACGAISVICTVNADSSPNFRNKPATEYAAIDGTYSSVTWAGASDEKLAFRLPDLVCPRSSWPANCTDYQVIPEGSFITNVQVAVRHNEGSWSGPGATGTFTPGSAIDQVQLHIVPGENGRGSNGNVYGVGSWDSNTNLGVNGGNGMPVCGSTALQNPANPPNDTANWCRYEYGVPGGRAASTFEEANADYTRQRDLTDSFQSPEAISKAEFTWTVKARNNGLTHEARLDGIELKVSYRPAGSLRPIRGCESTRTEFAPGSLVPPASAPNPGNINAAPEYSWFDADWGTHPSDSSSSLLADDPFTTFANSTGAGNDEAASRNGCALVAIDTSASVAKVHLQGMIYAPSAALYLTGNDNDSSWSTDGITARQITAFRWKRGNGLPAVGGTAPRRYNRKMYIELRNSSGKVVLRQFVEMGDNEMQDIGMFPPKILSSVENPS